jgi:CheY-like chemotaxis protein
MASEQAPPAGHYGASRSRESRAVAAQMRNDRPVACRGRHRRNIDISVNDVRLFSSAQEFMQAARPDAPGCLVLDVRLPGMSGLTFQQELTKAGVALPIVFITGNGDVSDDRACDEGRRQTRAGPIPKS